MDPATARLAYETGVISLKKAILLITKANTYGHMWDAYKYLTKKTDADEVYEFHEAVWDVMIAE